MLFEKTHTSNIRNSGNKNKEDSEREKERTQESKGARNKTRHVRESQKTSRADGNWQWIIRVEDGRKQVER